MSPAKSPPPLHPEAEQAIARAVTFALDPVQWVGGGAALGPQNLAKRFDVVQMTDSHIENTLRMIRTGQTASGVPFVRKQINGLTNEQWIQIFEDELVRRAYADTKQKR